MSTTVFISTLANRKHTTTQYKGSLSCVEFCGSAVSIQIVNDKSERHKIWNYLIVNGLTVCVRILKKIYFTWKAVYKSIVFYVGRYIDVVFLIVTPISEMCKNLVLISPKLVIPCLHLKQV